LFNIRKVSRRTFLYTGAVVAAGAALSTDGFVESNDPHVVRREIPLRRLPRSFDGFTIAHISDFHYEHHFSVLPIRKAVEMVNALRPDLIALTGDFITVPIFDRARFLRKSAETAIPCAALLSQLQAPKYANFGKSRCDGESATHRAFASGPWHSRASQ
jgi:predicted MPP superfamily phosphohydrolase